MTNQGERAVIATFKTRHFLWTICGCCNGNGAVENPAFSNGFTSSEWAEMSADLDGEGESAADRYLSGVYDVPCATCGATGKVREPDLRAMPRTERRAYVAYLRHQRAAHAADREIQAECTAELRMGC